MGRRKYKGPVTLLPNFYYSAPYTVDEREEAPLVYPPDTDSFIHAYNDVAAARKTRFLKDASHYLWTVGEELARYGFAPAAVISNPAGVAVSGDVWADYRHPEHETWIHLNVSETSVDIIGEAPPIGTYPTTRAFTTRKDRICVMGRWHAPPPKHLRGAATREARGTSGPNNWYDANMNSRELADAVVRLLDIEPQPVKESVQGSLFDLAAA